MVRHKYGSLVDSTNHPVFEGLARQYAFVHTGCMAHGDAVYVLRITSTFDCDMTCSAIVAANNGRHRLAASDSWYVHVRAGAVQPTDAVQTLCAPQPGRCKRSRRQRFLWSGHSRPVRHHLRCLRVAYQLWGLPVCSCATAPCNSQQHFRVFSLGCTAL